MQLIAWTVLLHATHRTKRADERQTPCEHARYFCLVWRGDRRVRVTVPSEPFSSAKAIAARPPCGAGTDGAPEHRTLRRPVDGRPPGKHAGEAGRADTTQATDRCRTQSRWAACTWILKTDCILDDAVAMRSITPVLHASQQSSMIAAIVAYNLLGSLPP